MNSNLVQLGSDPQQHTALSVKDLHLFAQQTPSYIAQHQLLNYQTPELLRALAQNKDLHPYIWQQLYLEDDEATRAYLLHNATTPEQAAKILQSPSASALALKLGVPKMSAQVYRQLLNSNFFSVEHAAGLLLHGVPTIDSARKFWELVKANRPVSLATTTYPTSLNAVLKHYSSLVTDAELLRMIEHDSYVLPSDIPALVDLRPSIIPELLLTAQVDSCRAVAGCQHLTQEQAEQLLNLLLTTVQLTFSWSIVLTLAILLHDNPSLTYELRLRAAELALRLEEAHSSFSGPASTNFLGTNILLNVVQECKALVASGAKHLTTPWHQITPDQLLEVAQIRQLLKTNGPLCYPTLKGHHLLTEYESKPYQSNSFTDPSPELDAAGPAAWEVFISLLPGWPAGVADLGAVAVRSVL